MIKKMLWVCFVLAWATGAAAQSYHFSQFYSTPLLVNPAFTGFTDGPWRAAANFRSQSVAGGSPYLTHTLSADFSPFRKSLPEGDRAGMGFFAMNDQSLGGALQTNTIGLSLAYNIVLNQSDATQLLGLGVQGTYRQQSINTQKLQFESQFGSNGFDASLPIGETINFGSKHYFDVNAGLLYNFLGEGQSFFAGVSGYSLLQQSDNLLPEAFKNPRRFTVTGGGQLATGETDHVYFSMNYMHQAGAHEYTLGAAYGIGMGTDQQAELDIGVWHRLKDAVIPYAGLKLNNFQLGFSYDVTISALKSAGNTKNGFELTLIYNKADLAELKRLIPWY